MGFVPKKSACVDSIWGGLLDLLYPPRCQCCQEFSADLICVECAQGFQSVEPPFCEQCGVPFDPAAIVVGVCGECREGRCALGRMRSTFYFRESVRTAIHAFKYRGCRRLFRPLGEMMGGRFPELFGNLQVQCILPVPLHPRRERERGFNQAVLLASVIGETCAIPVMSDVLHRSKFTQPQVGLTKAQRAENMRGAFTVTRGEAVREKRVLLVDDVLTTGSTIAACARILTKAGAAAVYGYTLARDK
ncbi:MAG: hypothetical protein AUJ92_20425 [Armatimonadetes bacterium CG2_30_59_28]|nr:MAG: hypothetical protein AUJ92_20425 [Armatimonadetes bacterium CG2_30_59_28]PIU64194.1 MAG: amidophosphoribosyltransferase [Armatimonadetes bacterium CG07_land_8_20_14_0_80_59_28]PIY48102.1 MAG: amidophosphoribosyltransferase [Armatimonadetes bacterium CG_4_10_14_3_um_filter_59_10]